MLKQFDVHWIKGIFYPHWLIHLRSRIGLSTLHASAIEWTLYDLTCVFTNLQRNQQARFRTLVVPCRAVTVPQFFKVIRNPLYNTRACVRAAHWSSSSCCFDQARYEASCAIFSFVVLRLFVSARCIAIIHSVDSLVNMILAESCLCTSCRTPLATNAYAHCILTIC